MSKHLMDTVTRMPLNIVAAKGPRIIGADGSSYYDMWNDEGVNSLGWNTPEIHQRVNEFFANNHPHQLADIYPNPIRSWSADRLCEVTSMDKIFFANSGTEAIEAAIKLARKHHHDRATGRRSIATLAGNFHGRTGFAMAASDATDSPYHKIGYDPMPEGFYVVQDLDGIKPESTCAFMMAPILGNNVVHTYDPQWLLEVRKFCTDHDILLIFDEIQVGMGRAGDWTAWKAISRELGASVKPDIMTLGKGIAAGFPMSACLAIEGVAAAFTPGVHFNTFAGSPFVCWMNLMVLDYLEKHFEEIRTNGRFIKESFMERGWIQHHDGMGIHWAFTPAWEGFNGFKFCECITKYGVIMATWREFGPIRFCPPLNATVSDLKMIFKAMDHAHKDLTGGN